MRSELVGVYAKLDRAEEHIDHLRTDLLSYYHDDPPAVSGQVTFDLQSRFADWSLVKRGNVPPRIRILIGEAASSLRGALDHLAWQLVLKAGNKPTKKTQFPILTRSADPKNTPRCGFRRCIQA